MNIRKNVRFFFDKVIVCLSIIDKQFDLIVKILFELFDKIDLFI